jgi:dTDP-4-amino-4,6-dideoxygalactose transaminase
MREMRNFGFGKTREANRLGINAKMPETSAAVGVRSLEMLEQISKKNRANYFQYQECLAGCQGVKLCAPVDPESSNCQYVAIEVDESASGISRDLLMNLLRSEGILTQRYWHPGCHTAAPYREEHARRGVSLPVTEHLSQTVLALPTGTSVSMGDISRISALIRFVMKSGEDILNKSRSQGASLQIA